MTFYGSRGTCGADPSYGVGRTDPGGTGRIDTGYISDMTWGNDNNTKELNVKGAGQGKGAHLERVLQSMRRQHLIVSITPLRISSRNCGKCPSDVAQPISLRCCLSLICMVVVVVAWRLKAEWDPFLERARRCAGGRR